MGRTRGVTYFGALLLSTVFSNAPNGARRRFLGTAAAASALGTFFGLDFAQVAEPEPEREFAPQPGAWRTADVTTRIDIAAPLGTARVLLPVPRVNSNWQSR